jgi:hypothetical protein
MQRQRVSSSNIASVGYDADAAILEIEFNDGSVYEYYDVPESVYDGLMAASSHGKYFHGHIRDVYRFRRIR